MTVSLFPANPVSLLTAQDNSESTYTFSLDILFDDPHYITHVRFWSALNALGTSPQGAVYTTGGVQQGIASFTGLTLGQWNTVAMPSPIEVLGGTSRQIVVGPLNRYAAAVGLFPYNPGGALHGSNGRFLQQPAFGLPVMAPNITWYSMDVVAEPITSGGGRRTIIVSASRVLRRATRAVPIFLHTPRYPILTGTPVRYDISGPGLKWTVTMSTTHVSVLSREFLPFEVSAYVAGRPYNPTSCAFAVAFLTGSREEPTSGDWVTGDWDQNLVGTYVGRVLVGPGSGAVLAAGRYYPWVRITDPTSGETVIRQVGKLFID